MNKNTLLIPAVKLFGAYLIFTMIPSGIYQIQIAFSIQNQMNKPILFITLLSLLFIINLLLKKPDIFSFKNEETDDLRSKQVFNIGIVIMGVYFAFIAFASFTSKILGSLIYQLSLGNSPLYASMQIGGYIFNSSLYQLLIAVFILYRAKNVLPQFKGFKREEVKAE